MYEGLSSGFPCLGVLTRHILWDLGMRRELRIACAPCHSCRPAIAKWLSQEITACNEVLSLCGKSPVLCVQTGDVKKEQTVSRRLFFRALLQTVGQEVEAVAKREAGTAYSFIPQHWLAQHGEHHSTASRTLLSGIEVTNSCDGCRLCEKLCPLDILPTAKAGGFLDTDGICLLKCRSYDTSPKKVDAPTFKIFFAAFLSRS